MARGKSISSIPDAGEFRVRVFANTPEHREVQDSAFLWAPGESAVVDGAGAGERADRSRQEVVCPG